MHPSPRPLAQPQSRRRPRPVAIRCEAGGYGVRFGLTEAEDALSRGPVFATLPEALAFVEALDRARSA